MTVLVVETVAGCFVGLPLVNQARGFWVSKGNKEKESEEVQGWAEDGVITYRWT